MRRRSSTPMLFTVLALEACMSPFSAPRTASDRSAGPSGPAMTAPGEPAWVGTLVTAAGSDDGATSESFRRPDQANQDMTDRASITWEVTWPRPVRRSIQIFLSSIGSLDFSVSDATGTTLATGSIVRAGADQATASCTLEVAPGEGYVARCEAFDLAPGAPGRQRLASASSDPFIARPGRIEPVALRLVPDHPPDLRAVAAPVTGTGGAAIAAPGDELSLAVGAESPQEPVVWFPARPGAADPDLRNLEGVPMVPAVPSAVVPGLVKVRVPAGAGSGIPWLETRLGARRFATPIWIPSLSLTTPTEFFDAFSAQNLFLVLDVHSIPSGSSISAPGQRVVTGHVDYVSAAGVPLASLGATPSAPLGWKLVQDTVGTLTASGDMVVVVVSNPLPGGTSQKIAELEASLAGARSPKLRLGFVKPCDYVTCN
jgi:hypothetical protein